MLRELCIINSGMHKLGNSQDTLKFYQAQLLVHYGDNNANIHRMSKSKEDRFHF